MKGRSRIIQYNFFMNEDLAELSFQVRLLFIGLFTLADKAGRLEYRPKKIKAMIFPYDDINVKTSIKSLSDSGFVLIYDEKYLQIINWDKHQNPHNRESESELPEPYNLMLNTESKNLESANQVTSTSTETSIRTSTRKETRTRIDLFVELYHEHCPMLSKVRKITVKRFSAISQRLIDEPDLEVWKLVFVTASQSPFLLGTNDRGWRADIDFFAQPDSYVKILEGKYQNNKQSKSKTRQTDNRKTLVKFAGGK